MNKTTYTFFSAFFISAPLLFSSLAIGQAPPGLDRWTETGLTRTAWGRDNGLQSNAPGDPLRLTWGIFREGSTIFGNTPANNFRSRLNQIYAGGEAEWLPLMESAFERWESVSGLDFTYETNDDGAGFLNTSGVTGARADIRIGGTMLDGNSGVLAAAFFPSREIVFDTNDNFYNNTSDNSLRLRQVLAHEVGHLLGMAHVLDSTPSYLMEPSFIPNFDGPQLHDIMMAQWGYGDSYEKANGFLGNDDFNTAIDVGTIESGVIYSIGEDARIDFNATIAEVFPDQVDFVSIDDESDVDTFRFSLEDTTLVKLDLESLGFEYTTGPDGGTPTAFNSRARSDLSFELFDAAENSIALIDESGLQGLESLTQSLVAGDYFVKIYGSDNSDATEIDTQFYSFSIAAVPEPSSIVLLLAAGLFPLCRRNKVRRVPRRE